jgi:hypothetical protein
MPPSNLLHTHPHSQPLAFVKPRPNALRPPPCSTTTSYDSTLLTISSTGDASGKKVDLSNFGADGYGEVVWLFKPTGANNQQWTYDATTGLLLTKSDKVGGGGGGAGGAAGGGGGGMRNEEEDEEEVKK